MRTLIAFVGFGAAYSFAAFFRAFPSGSVIQDGVMALSIRSERDVEAGRGHDEVISLTAAVGQVIERG